MKISVNDKELFSITEVQKKVIQDYIVKEIFEEDMKRRITWVINQIYKEAYKKLRLRYESKLVQEGIESLPTNPDAFAELVFAREDYKDRSAREAEAVINP